MGADSIQDTRTHFRWIFTYRFKKTSQPHATNSPLFCWKPLLCEDCGFDARCLISNTENLVSLHNGVVGVMGLPHQLR